MRYYVFFMRTEKRGIMPLKQETLPLVLVQQHAIELWEEKKKDIQAYQMVSTR